MLDHDYLSLWQVRLNRGEQRLNRKRKSAATTGLTFVFPRAGHGNCVSGSTTYPIGPGDVLVLGSSAEYRLAVNNGGEMVANGFSVLFQQLFPIIAGDQLRVVRGFVDGLKHPRIYVASSAIAAECHRRIRDVPMDLNFDHRCQLLRVAGALLDSEVAQASPFGPVRSEEQIMDVLQKLSVAQISTMSVEDLARKFNCSRRQLNRLFRKYLGVSVATLTMEMRLLHAASLLRDPELKVINVAEECGFNHLGLFNGCFKRRFGVSPSEFRKTMNAMPPKRPKGKAGDCWLRARALCPGW